MDYELINEWKYKIRSKGSWFYSRFHIWKNKPKWLFWKMARIFSHPGDFTPVCTTEMIAFARAYPFFQN